ncbi:hypothetical protein CEXT_133571 [Caerostris extrusa]|uniref:Uncharacterized protein n=1 Tax=Caerostris extrusa TaxID=172846 RepID=A0AAV4NAE6_CAEEX|nr:hypothetical protein CEXT_133571 [Caerostris extrusa]
MTLGNQTRARAKGWDVGFRGPELSLKRPTLDHHIILHQWTVFVELEEINQYETCLSASDEINQFIICVSASRRNKSACLVE